MDDGRLGMASLRGKTSHYSNYSVNDLARLRACSTKLSVILWDSPEQKISVVHNITPLDRRKSDLVSKSDVAASPLSADAYYRHSIMFEEHANDALVIFETRSGRPLKL